MTRIIVERSTEDEKLLKARTRERATVQLRAALTKSRKEETAGKGRRFKSVREPIRWLES